MAPQCKIEFLNRRLDYVGENKSRKEIVQGGL